MQATMVDLTHDDQDRQTNTWKQTARGEKQRPRKKGLKYELLHPKTNLRSLSSVQ